MKFPFEWMGGKALAIQLTLWRRNAIDVVEATAKPILDDEL
jgi:hypothetical protein